MQRHKIGDTFYAEGAYRDDDDQPVNLTTAEITVKSAVLAPDQVTRWPLTVTLKNQDTNPGEYTMIAQTRGWKPGAAKHDIQYEDAEGIITSTATVEIYLEPDVTR